MRSYLQKESELGMRELIDNRESEKAKAMLMSYQGVTYQESSYRESKFKVNNGLQITSMKSFTPRSMKQKKKLDKALRCK